MAPDWISLPVQNTLANLYDAEENDPVKLFMVMATMATYSIKYRLNPLSWLKEEFLRKWPENPLTTLGKSVIGAVKHLKCFINLRL